MKIVDYRELGVSGTTDYTINFNKNEIGNTVTSEVYVQLLSDCEMTATGYVSSKKNGVSLKMINLGDFSTAETATEAGLYLILAGSLESLKLDFDGTSQVIIKTIF